MTKYRLFVVNHAIGLTNMRKKSYLETSQKHMTECACAMLMTAGLTLPIETISVILMLGGDGDLKM